MMYSWLGRAVPRPRTTALLLAAVAVLLVLLPSSPAVAAPADDGLRWLNTLRSVAGLQPVRHDPSLATGVTDHARYMASNRTIGHSQDPTKAGYSIAGYRAATESNLSLWKDAAAGHGVVDHIDRIHTAPFHQIGHLRLGLRTAAVGYHAQGGTSAAVVNILAGLTTTAPRSPIAYPGPGSTSTLTTYGGDEWPDPLTACAGYAAPTGAPITVLLPEAATATGVELRGPSGALEACVFDATTYTHPDASSQALARRILRHDRAVVVIPRAPLQAGAYTVGLRFADRDSLQWSFAVGAVARPASGTFGPITRSTPLPVPDQPRMRPLSAACPTAASASLGFRDLAGSVYAEDVACAVDWGITSGVDPQRFDPARTVTRAQLASMLDRLLAATGHHPAATPPRFPDVPTDNVHAAAIGRLAAAGIVAGQRDGGFDPAGQVTRAQLATMLVRIYEQVWDGGIQAASGRGLVDVPAGAAHQRAIEAASTMGAIIPVGEGASATFHPAAPVTRAQLASHVMSLIDYALRQGRLNLPHDRT